MVRNVISLARLREVTEENPLCVITSACLVGEKVGWDDRAYTSSLVQKLVQHPKVKAVRFCPEHLILGTPRLLTTLHKGNGFDVLDGQAQVRDTDNNDLTEKFIYSAERFLEFAKANNVDLAVLMEISDSCGSTAVYLGRAEEKVYQQGPGVSSALLMRNGIPVLGSRDHRSIGRLLLLLEGKEGEAEGIDFREDPWFREYFKSELVQKG